LPFDLYLISDRHQTQGRDLLWVLEQALEGGVKAVQLREKDLGGRDLFVLAEKFKRLCERYQAALFVNDRIDIALGVDADGVQLGSASMPVEAVRSLIGEGKQIGVSMHSLKEAKEAQQAGADFVLFGPVYFTPSKAAYGEPQGLARLKKIVEKISLPVYAIGGIKAVHIGELKKTGIQGVALISAIMEASNPLSASRELLRILGGDKA
jgi:thiamine-phosphate pyrophosphorylase